MAEKIKIDYDEEFDDLYIYKIGKTSDFSVNLGDFVIDVGKGGSIKNNTANYDNKSKLIDILLILLR